MWKIKNKIAALLLFAIAIAWGNIWTTEILSCPEWWFIGMNALLLGTGIYLSDLLPESWRNVVPGVLLALVLLIDFPVLKSVMLPLSSGIWFGSNSNLYRSWKASRTFCAGLLIGGILSGVSDHQETVLLCSVVFILLHSGLRSSAMQFVDMLLLAGFYLWAQPEKSVNQPIPVKIEPGTVITAFAAVPEKTNNDRLPRIVFVGGNSESHYRSGVILNPVADLVFLPDLPGTVPQNSDLIIVSQLPETGNSGVGALSRSLMPGGILVLPVEYCKFLPRSSWYILPGSDNRYAATSPGRELDLDPVKLDDGLHSHFARQPEYAPLRGALAGLLVDYHAEKVVSVTPVTGKNFFRYIHYTLAAGIFLLVIWLFRAKKGGRDNLLILINCAGLALLFAMLMPKALAGLPAVPAVSSLMTVVALVWFFRRPVKWDADKNSSGKYDNGENRISGRSFRLILSGGISFIALLGSFGGHWIPALTALISGGYFFAELDGELCGERDVSSESIRFLGVALGAFAASYMQYAGVPFWIFFLTVIFLRGWSLLRS